MQSAPKVSDDAAKKPAPVNPQKGIEACIDSLYKCEARVVHYKNHQIKNAGLPRIETYDQFKPELENQHLRQTRKMLDDTKANLMGCVDVANHAELDKIFNQISNNYLYTQCASWLNRKFDSQNAGQPFQALNDLLKTAKPPVDPDPVKNKQNIDNLKKAESDMKDLSQKTFNKGLEEAHKILQRQVEIDRQLAYSITQGYTNDQGAPIKLALHRLDDKEERTKYLTEQDQKNTMAHISTKTPGPLFKAGVWGDGKDDFMIGENGVRPCLSGTAGMFSLTSRQFERNYGKAVDIALMRKEDDDHRVSINFGEPKDGDYNSLMAIFRVLKAKHVGVNKDASKNLIEAIEHVRTHSFFGNSNARKLYAELARVSRDADDYHTLVQGNVGAIKSKHERDLTYSLHSKVEEAHEILQKARNIQNDTDLQAVKKDIDNALKVDINDPNVKFDEKEDHADQQNQLMKKCVQAVNNAAETDSVGLDKLKKVETKDWAEEKMKIIQDRAEKINAHKNGITLAEQKSDLDASELQTKVNKVGTESNEILADIKKNVDKIVNDPNSSADEKKQAQQKGDNEIFEVLKREKAALMTEANAVLSSGDDLDTKIKKLEVVKKGMEALDIKSNNIDKIFNDSVLKTTPDFNDFLASITKESTHLDKESNILEGTRSSNVGGVSQRPNPDNLNADAAIKEVEDKQSDKVTLTIEAKQSDKVIPAEEEKKDDNDDAPSVTFHN